MKKIEDLSDFIKAVHKEQIPFEENSVLNDLYKTLTEGLDEQQQVYQGQGVFRNTSLLFLEKGSCRPVAIPREELKKERLETVEGEPILEVQAKYRTGKTKRTYLKIIQGEVQIKGKTLCNYQQAKDFFESWIPNDKRN